MGVRSTNDPFTAQEARRITNNVLPTPDELVEDATQIIKGSAQDGCNSCVPFITTYNYYLGFCTPTRESKALIDNTIKEAIKVLESRSFKVKIPKKLLTRKPKYEYTVISW